MRYILYYYLIRQRKFKIELNTYLKHNYNIAKLDFIWRCDCYTMFEDKKKKKIQIYEFWSHRIILNEMY